DRFNVCVWPANIEVRDSGNQFFAPGFHGNLWESNDPAFDYVIVLPYMYAEVVATCIGHDDRDRTSIVTFTCRDFPGWTHMSEVPWSTTWGFMERMVMASRSFPRHRDLLFDADDDQPSNRMHVGPSFGLRASARRRL
ncbi:unnamed protein product, partial [Prorocentrum cordatum]